MSQRKCQRQYYRIRYPEADRPRLRTSTGEFEVLDCSEAGLCYQLSHGQPPELSSTVTGKIRFPAGETVEVGGTVLRTDGQTVALTLTKSIPFWLILDEQRRLRDRYVGQSKATAVEG